jgi:hypothetical protein
MAGRLAIMQPYLFPYLGYFQLMRAADRFVVYDDVAFIKQGWIARNRILINGEPSFFSVPVKHASSFVPIRETPVDDGPQHQRWAEKILKTFDNAYRRAPHFAQVFPIVESVFTTKATHVAEIAVASLKAVASYLDITCEWVETSSAYSNQSLSGAERVLDICRREGAADYINPPGGQELYDRQQFVDAGVRLWFLQPRPIEYRQFGRPFVPWLSIVDVLMFNDRERAKSLLDEYDLA